MRENMSNWNNVSTCSDGVSGEGYSIANLKRLKLQMRVNFTEDIIEGTLICHPEVYQKIIDKLNNRIASYTEVHCIRGAKVITDPYCEKEKQNGWDRTKTLEDDQFTSWVDDINNPPSWAIYFGLVQPKMEPIAFYMKRQPTIFKGGS